MSGGAATLLALRGITGLRPRHHVHQSGSPHTVAPRDELLLIGVRTYGSALR